MPISRRAPRRAPRKTRRNSSTPRRVRAVSQKLHDYSIGMLAKREHTVKIFPFMKDSVNKLNELLYTQYTYLDQLTYLAETIENPELQKAILKFLQRSLENTSVVENALTLVKSKPNPKKEANLAARIKKLTRRAPLDKYRSCIRRDRSTRTVNTRKLRGLVKQYEVEIEAVLKLSKDVIKLTAGKLPKNSMIFKLIDAGIRALKEMGPLLARIEHHAPTAPPCAVRERESFFETSLERIKKEGQSARSLYAIMDNDLKKNGKLNFI